MIIQIFFIFRGYFLDDFLNQYNKVIDVTELQYFTQCSWMFEGNLKLTSNCLGTFDYCGRSIIIG